MTPLAFDALKDLTTRGAFKSKNPNCREALWRMVHEAHFFELSGVQPLVMDLQTKLYASFTKRETLDRRLAFLPALTTWNEYVLAGRRVANVLISSDQATTTTTADIVFVHKQEGEWFALRMSKQPLPLIHSHDVPRIPAKPAWWQEPGDAPLGPFFANYAALALINSPRIIGRRQHMPHERVEREKLKSLGLVGKFPLRAWTEIILKVAPPDDRTGEPATEGHLTGEKCLHFVRTFLRVRMGRLEYVDAHWRGNPALGMRRSRYRLEPGEGVEQ